MEVERSTSSLGHYLSPNSLHSNEKEVLLRSMEMQEVLNSHFDYDSLLAKSKKDFYDKWIILEPSLHMGPIAYRFETLPLLGTGNFGTVHLLTDGDDCMALKVLKKIKVMKDKVVEKTIRERKVLNAVDFPFLISLKHSCKDHDFLYLALPFVGGGDLFDYHRKLKRFTEHTTRFYAAQVVCALEYLHNIKCLYRDIKLENILLETNGYLKLTDFGLSKFVEGRTSTLCGTPEYLAPEMLGLKPYGTSVDWWSFGILVYEFVAGQTPFVRYSSNLVLMYSKITEGSFEMPKYFSDDLRDLINGLLRVQHAQRLGSLCNGSIGIKNHRFFRTINWEHLLQQKIPPPHRPRLQSACDTSNFRKPNLKSFNISQRSKLDQYTETFKDF